MHPRTRLVPLAALALAACTDMPVAPPTAPAAALAAAGTTTTDLSALGVPGTPVGINDRGDVVGGCADGADRFRNGDSRGAGSPAFIWSAAEGVRLLGLLDGAPTCAAAINEAGQVVGRSTAGHAFVWTAAGGMRDLGPGAAVDVNNAGQAVGWAGADAVLWDLGTGERRTLGSVAGPYATQETRAAAINDLGQVTGTVVVGPSSGASGSSLPPRPLAFIWTPTAGARVIAAWQGESDEVYPSAISDRGLIVGRYENFGTPGEMVADTTGARLGGPTVGCSPYDPGRYTAVNDGDFATLACVLAGDASYTGRGYVINPRTGFVERLPTLPNHRDVNPRALNNRGQVVGRVDDPGSYSYTAVLWTVPAAVTTPITPPSRPAPPAAVTPLVDRNSGRCLDVLGASRELGTPLVIYDCLNGENQRFAIPAVGQTGEVRVYGDRCLDAEAAGTGNGTRLIVWECYGGANQQWTRTAGGELRGVQSGKCVDVQGVQTANLTPVWLWDCLSAPNQSWEARATPPAGPAPALLVDRNSGRCLDVLGAGRAAGTPLVLFDCHGGENQQFTYPAAGQAGELRVYGDRCVSTTQNTGTPLTITLCDGGLRQRWARTAAGEFRSVQYGGCVDVQGARTDNTTPVWLWTCLGTPNQQWDPRAPSQAVASAAR
jgi:probable HAF family extracellular repeat protein